MTTYQKIKMLCEKEGFAISSISNHIPGADVTRGTITGWKKGSLPRASTLKAIADYFNVPVDYFVNESDESINYSFNNIHGDNNVIGHTETAPLSPNEAALLSMFRKMDIIKQAKLITMASELLAH